MSLAPHYRFQLFNNTGATTSAGDLSKVDAKRKKIDSSGAVVFESSEASLFSGGGSLASGSYANSSTITNTNDKYIGGDFKVEFDHTNSPSGEMVMLYQTSTDGGSTWPEDGAGEVIAVADFSANGTKRRQAEL